MKKLILSIGLALVAGVIHAQTNTPANFFLDVEQYLTSFNTNYTFEGVTFEAATGYKQVTGVGAASVLDVQYDISRFHIIGSGQFSGVGSDFNVAEVGIGYDVIQHYDTALEFNIQGGYDWVQNTSEVEPKVDIKKKLGPNTFAETGISLPFYMNRKQSPTPSFYIETGFTF